MTNKIHINPTPSVERRRWLQSVLVSVLFFTFAPPSGAWLIELTDSGGVGGAVIGGDLISTIVPGTTDVFQGFQIAAGSPSNAISFAAGNHGFIVQTSGSSGTYANQAYGGDPSNANVGTQGPGANLYSLTSLFAVPGALLGTLGSPPVATQTTPTSATSLIAFSGGIPTGTWVTVGTDQSSRFAFVFAATCFMGWRLWAARTTGTS